MDDLSNDDKLQIFKYLDNGMEQEERTQFEARLKNNAALSEAFNFEKGLMHLGHSAGLKIKDYLNAEEESKDKNDIDLVKRARENWESENTYHLKDKPYVEKPNSALQGEPLRGDPVQMKRIAIRKIFAVAALVTAITASLYFLIEKSGSKISGNVQKADSSQKKHRIDTSIQNINTPESVPSDYQHKIKPAENSNIAEISKGKREALFAHNFKPDIVPADMPDVLQEPLAYYEATQYKDAVTAFENIDPDFLSRGSDVNKKRILFYTSYYKSLSFLASGHVSKAIPELEKAIRESPDTMQTTKAKWYLALANIKIGDLVVATNLLNQLANNNVDTYYRKMSLSLKDQMHK